MLAALPAAVLLTAAALLACADPLLDDTNQNRHKRLLFYDEQGNLVQTHPNPLHNFPEEIGNMPFFGSFFQPLYNYLRPISTFGGRPMTYMIPVSEEVIHQISTDPLMQNKLILLPARNPIIEMNNLCTGKRAQIPSPKLCNNFLNCWDGWAFEQECPSGLFFSDEGFCDYPEKVDCSNRKKNDFRADGVAVGQFTPPASEAAGQPEARCARDLAAFRSPQSCAEFFVCVGRRPVRFLCPADLAFNEDLAICDYPDKVNCSSPSSQPAPAPAAAAGPGPQDNTLLLRSSVFNSQSWSSHIAMSRQDAIRQLQLGRLANVNTSN